MAILPININDSPQFTKNLTSDSSRTAVIDLKMFLLWHIYSVLMEKATVYAGANFPREPHFQKIHILLFFTLSRHSNSMCVIVVTYKREHFLLTLTKKPL
jgi:hypothetical protein